MHLHGKQNWAGEQLCLQASAPNPNKFLFFLRVKQQNKENPAFEVEHLIVPCCSKCWFKRNSLCWHRLDGSRAISFTTVAVLALRRDSSGSQSPQEILPIDKFINCVQQRPRLARGVCRAAVVVQHRSWIRWIHTCWWFLGAARWVLSLGSLLPHLVRKNP